MKMAFIQLGKQSGNVFLNEEGRKYVARAARYFGDNRPCFIFAWPFSGITFDAAKMIGEAIGIDVLDIETVVPAGLRSCKMIVAVIQEDKVPPILDTLAVEFGHSCIYLPAGEGFVGDGYILDLDDPLFHYERLPPASE